MAIVFLGARGIDGEDHARAVRAILELREQQTQLDDVLHHLRFEADVDTTALVPALVRLEDGTAALPGCIDLDRHGAVSGPLMEYMDGLRAVRDQVGRAAALADLWHDERAQAVGAGNRRDDGAVAAESERAQRLAQLAAELEIALASIDAATLAQRSDAVLASYERSFADLMDVAETYRLCLYLITGLLLVRLVQSMRTLQMRTDELRTVNHTLEERVEERTRTLSSTNRALETAISEARRAERDARAARETAETASQTKSSFLANMSHEIRAPMTSILGFSERLVDEEISEAERQDAIATIRRNGELLLQLVSDVLDLSKVEAGKLTIERVDCSPWRIVAEMQEELAQRAHEKSIEFIVAWDGPVPEVVRTDPLRVKQVLFNLVGNAIKFTERGRVVLRVGYQPPAASGVAGKLAFTVEDTGIGMDEATLSRLFRPFTQGESSTSRRFGGTGLGLSICRHLAEELGGAISVSSRPGEGSTFAFRLDLELLDTPLVPGATVPAPGVVTATTAPSLAGMRVLVAEDGDDNLRLLRHLLGGAGATVSVAVDGEEAVHLALTAEAHGCPFDAVLMDMQMPRVDGFEATRRLRAAGYKRPIVALTAHALAADRENCLAAGCDDYCTKPMRRAVLLEKVGRWRAGGVEEEPAILKPRPGIALGDEPDETLLQLVRLFVEEMRCDVAEMRGALQSGEIERLSMLAHRLKGAAGSYGFPEITKQAGLLEKVANHGERAEAIATELASLETLCSRARAS